MSYNLLMTDDLPVHLPSNRNREHLQSRQRRKPSEQWRLIVGSERRWNLGRREDYWSMNTKLDRQTLNYSKEMWLINIQHPLLLHLIPSWALSSLPRWDTSRLQTNLIRSSSTPAKVLLTRMATISHTLTVKQLYYTSSLTLPYSTTNL